MMETCKNIAERSYKDVRSTRIAAAAPTFAPALACASLFRLDAR